MKKNTLQLLAFLCILFSAPFLIAQENVQSLNESGLNAFGEGRYVEAAELFGRAYALEPRPELLKNRAIALYRADRCKEALPVASIFLQNKITPAEREQISSLQDGCYVVLAEKAIVAKDFDRATEFVAKARNLPALRERVVSIKNAITDANILLPMRRRKPLSTISMEDKPNIVVNKKGGKKEKVERADNTLAWVLIGIGSLTLVGTGIYHRHEQHATETEFRTVAQAGTDRTRYDQLDARLRLANWLVPTLYLVGAATAVSGLTLYFIPQENDDAFKGVAWRTSF